MKSLILLFLFTCLPFLFFAKPAQAKPRIYTSGNKTVIVSDNKDGVIETFVTPKSQTIRIDRNKDGAFETVFLADQKTEVLMKSLHRGVYQTVETKARTNRGIIESKFIFRPLYKRYMLVKQELSPFKELHYDQICEPSKNGIERLIEFFNQDPLLADEYKKAIDSSCKRSPYAGYSDSLASALAGLSIRLEDERNDVTNCISRITGPLTAYRMRAQLLEQRWKGYDNDKSLIRCEYNPSGKQATYDSSSRLISIHSLPTSKNEFDQKVWATNLLSHELLHRAGVDDDNTVMTAVGCCIHGENTSASCASVAPPNSELLDELIETYRRDPFILELIAESESSSMTSDQKKELLEKLKDLRLRKENELAAANCADSGRVSQLPECRRAVEKALKETYKEALDGRSSICNLTGNQGNICDSLKDAAYNSVPQQRQKCIGQNLENEYTGDCSFVARREAMVIIQPLELNSVLQPLDVSSILRDIKPPLPGLEEAIVASEKYQATEQARSQSRATSTLEGATDASGTSKTANFMTTRLGVNIQRQTVTPTESQAEPSRSAVVAAADAQIATTPQASTIGAHIDVKNTAAINAEFDNLERASYQILSSAAPVTLASNSVTPSSSASSSSSSRSRYVSRSSSSRSMASIRSPKAPTSKSRAEGNRQETFALPPLLGFPTLAVAASIPEAQATTASLGPGLDSSGSSAVSASGLNAGGRSKTNRSSKTTTTTTSGEDVSYTGGNSGSISGSSNINSGGGGGRSTTSASSPFDEKRVRQDLEKNWQSFYQHMQGPKRRETVGWLYSNGIEIVKRRTCDDSRNPSCGALREGSKNPTVQYVFSSELKPPKKINPKDD